MKKALLSICFLWVLMGCLYANPTNSVSVPSPAVANAVISSSEYNANNNEVQTKYNSHTHADITQLGTITQGVWAGTAVNYSSLELTDSIVGADLSDDAMSKIYPVGSVYLSVVSTDPATLFGFGTWTQIAQGQMLIGQKSSDADFDTAEETGGAKTHTLTSDEMPAHVHSVSGYWGAAALGYNTINSDNSANPQSFNSGSTGGGQAHSIMNPYLVVYIWKRVS